MRPSIPTPRGDLAVEIDRLLRQLPGRDPSIALASGPSHPRPTQARPGPRPSLSGSLRPPAHPLEPSLLAQQVAAWVRVGLAACLGLAVLWWPYAASCGWTLYAFMGVIGAVLIAGGWASICAWRVRIASAHVLSLFVMYWGCVLAAEQVLPRIGYAAANAAWVCTR